VEAACDPYVGCRLMATVSTATISRLLEPYLEGADVPGLYEKLGDYLDLLLKWNARTNLTAIREPEEIVRRHFGESLFAGRHLPECTTLLDLGSGAGFPGVPIQLLRPEIAMTLAESQGKKASFLREAVRTLGLKSEVWAGRVEMMPAERGFDVVALRAVDKMPDALALAGERSSHSVVVLAAASPGIESAIGEGFGLSDSFEVPESVNRRVLIFSRV
jgi:16S rRNA (guanine527-N7)-methyltransferase